MRRTVLSANPHEPYVFGSHVASTGDVGVRSARASSGPLTAAALREVPPDHDLTRLCARAAEAMPASMRTAVVLVAPPGPAAPTEELTAAIATSSPRAAAVLKIEWLLREGPVRTSLGSGEVAVSHQLRTDGRWPRFARAVPAHDTVSAAAVPIPLAVSAGSGVLAAYSREEAAFEQRDLRVLTAFARVVADAVAREAVATPDGDEETLRLVNQAVGVLITRHCDEEQAVHRLRRISESTGRPLADAARLIVNEARVEAHLRFVVRSPQERMQPGSDR